MKRLVSVLLLAVLSVIAGCGSSNNDFIFTNQQQAGPRGFLRFAHLSPDAPNVDISVDGTSVATNVPFQTFSRYTPFTPGQRRVQIFPTGTTTAVIDTNVNVAVNTRQTVAATNTVANIGATVYSDTATNDPTQVFLRVVHAAPDAPAVDLTLADGTVLAGGLTFPNATAYLPLAAGTYNLQIRVAGTNQVVRDFPGVTLSNGTVLSAVAVGLLSDQSLDVLVANDDPNDGSATSNLAESITTLRVAHLSTDAGPVDITLDGITIATNVSFPTVGQYLNTPTRDAAQVRVFATGTNNQLLTTSLNLVADQVNTVAATGSIADSNIGLTAYVDDRQGEPAGAKVRAVHASPDAPAVDVTANGALIASSIIFPNAGNYAGVAANPNATINVNLGGGGALVTSVNNVDLQANKTYSAFVIGRVGGPAVTVLVAQDSP